MLHLLLPVLTDTDTVCRHGVCGVLLPLRCSCRVPVTLIFFLNGLECKSTAACSRSSPLPRHAGCLLSTSQCSALFLRPTFHSYSTCSQAATGSAQCPDLASSPPSRCCHHHVTSSTTLHPVVDHSLLAFSVDPDLDALFFLWASLHPSPNHAVLLSLLFLLLRQQAIHARQDACKTHVRWELLCVRVLCVTVRACASALFTPGEGAAPWGHGRAECKKGKSRRSSVD